MQHNVSIMRQSKHNKKVAEAKKKSRSLINASLLWHFEQTSQFADLQAQIKHQDIKNIRLQNKIKILRETAQAYQNELNEKERAEAHSKIDLMIKEADDKRYKRVTE